MTISEKPSAVRMRRHRARKKNGFAYLVTIPLAPAEWHYLEKLGWASPADAQSTNRKNIVTRRAFLHLLRFHARLLKIDKSYGIYNHNGQRLSLSSLAE